MAEPSPPAWMKRWPSFVFLVAVMIAYGFFEMKVVGYVSKPTSVDEVYRHRYHQHYPTWKHLEARRWASQRNLTLTSHRLSRQQVRDDLITDWLSNHRDDQIAAALIDELAFAHGSAEVYKGHNQLTRIRDVLHESLWFPNCHREGRTRGCGPDTSLYWLVQHQMPTAVLLIVVVCMGVPSVASFDFVEANHNIYAHLLSRLIRTITFVSTTLGPVNPNCRLLFKGASESGGCGDLLFSGHGIVVTHALCFIWLRGHLHLPLWIKIPLSLAAFHTMFVSALERFHYTADMTLAFFVTVLVYISLDRYTHYISYEPKLEFTWASLLWLLTPIAFYVVFTMMGILHPL